MSTKANKSAGATEAAAAPLTVRTDTGGNPMPTIQPGNMVLSETPVANVFVTINRIMQDVDAIGKNKENSQQKFNYRGIDDMYNALHPLFAKHGLTVVPEEIIKEWTEERTSKYGTVMVYRLMHIRFRFYALDGSSITAILQGEAQDSADKASNKAQAVALKYALMIMFLIPTEELAKADPDGHGEEAATQNSQPVQIKEPTTDEKAQNMVGRSIEKAAVNDELRQRIANENDRVKLAGIYNSAPPELQSNEEFIQLIKTRRDFLVSQEKKAKNVPATN